MAMALSACTAQMDMTIDAAGTYDAVLVMRDTTGTVFTADTDCDDYTDPTLVGASQNATVTSTPIGSAGDDGLGCEVRISGVEVPEAAAAPSDGALVVRDGDLYVVTLAPYLAAEPTATDPAADPSGTSATTDSLNAVLDARLSVTFPGAVVDDGGGRVSGTTVTWDDADVLSAGVTASGYATEGQGRRTWESRGGLIAAAVAALGIVIGAVAWRRRGRHHTTR